MKQFSLFYLGNAIEIDSQRRNDKRTGSVIRARNEMSCNQEIRKIHNHSRNIEINEVAKKEKKRYISPSF